MEYYHLEREAEAHTQVRDRRTDAAVSGFPRFRAAPNCDVVIFSLYLSNKNEKKRLNGMRRIKESGRGGERGKEKQREKKQGRA